MSLIFLLICCMDAKFVGENPGSSLVFCYHAFLRAVALLKKAGIKARSQCQRFFVIKYIYIYIY